MKFSSFFYEIKEILKYPLFTINDTVVNMQSIFMFIIVLGLFFIFARLVRSRLLTKILVKFNIEEGIQFTLTRLTQYVVISIGVVVSFQFIGINLNGLAVILGFLSVGIGFGLQNVTSNFISGLILLFERPVNVGDRVTVGNTLGDVVNINIRSTTVRTVNNISIIVPNSEFITKEVTNWSHSDKKIRVDLEVGVSYNSDLDLILKVLNDVASENMEVLQNPAHEVHLKSFGDSSWNMSMRVWIADPKRYYYVISDLNCEIVRSFRANNIEIPFPQRDLHIKSVKPILENVYKKND